MDVPVRDTHAKDEWVPLREFMELRVRLAEELSKAIESRTDIKFSQVAHDAEITRLLNEAKFREHNTALEQNAKLAGTAALAQKDQAAEFARKAEVNAEVRSLSKQVEELKLSQTAALQEAIGRGKGNEPLQRIGMMIVSALVVVIVGGFATALFAVLKLSGTG